MASPNLVKREPLPRTPPPSVRRAGSVRALCVTTLLIPLLSTIACQAPAVNLERVWIATEDAWLIDVDPSRASEIYSPTDPRIRLVSAINETLAFQVVLEPNFSNAPVDVRLTDLSTDRGQRLPTAADARRYIVHASPSGPQPAWFFPHVDRDQFPAAVPDQLIPWTHSPGGGPVDPNDVRRHVVWIEFDVPPTTQPDRFRGHLELITRDEVAATSRTTRIDVELDVMPVALPSVPSLPVLARVDPRGLLEQQLDWPAREAADLLLLPQEPAHAEANALLNATMQLFREHQLHPLLDGSYPRFELTQRDTVVADWTPYQQLVDPWRTGTAYPDRVAPPGWIVPTNTNYPASPSGWLQSPRYLSLLTALLKLGVTRLEDAPSRNAYLMPIPLLDDTQRSTESWATALAQSSAIAAARQDRDIPGQFVAFAPPRSLAAFGWTDFPTAEFAGVDIWAPPADLLDPFEIDRLRDAGARSWLVPNHPPFSGALHHVAPPTDIRSLAWQAFRYRHAALYLHDAAPRAALDAQSRSTSPRGATAPLIYPGRAWNLQQPIASIRLKRLRRAIQDHALLDLLARQGDPLLARRIARTLVPAAHLDRALDTLTRTQPATWPQDPTTFHTARRLLLELCSNPGRNLGDRSTRVERWQRLLNQREPIAASFEGARLQSPSRAAAPPTLTLATQLTNQTDASLTVDVALTDAPAAWTRAGAPNRVLLATEGRSLTRTRAVVSPPFNAPGGHVPLTLECRSDTGASATLDAKLAVIQPAEINHRIRIDGILDDWPRDVGNQLANFQLTRPSQRATPQLPTFAWVCRDDEALYIAVHCVTPEAENPRWTPDTHFPTAGAIPWGQDLVELIFDPRKATDGAARDLLLMRVKPSGIVQTTRGCLTTPPISKVRPWEAPVELAVGRAITGWTVEARIPLTAFNADREASIWGFNVARLDARRGEYSNWAGAQGDCYHPRRLGNLLMP